MSSNFRTVTAVVACRRYGIRLYHNTTLVTVQQPAVINLELNAIAALFTSA